MPARPGLPGDWLPGRLSMRPGLEGRMYDVRVSKRDGVHGPVRRHSASRNVGAIPPGSRPDNLAPSTNLVSGFNDRGFTIPPPQRLQMQPRYRTVAGKYPATDIPTSSRHLDAQDASDRPITGRPQRVQRFPNVLATPLEFDRAGTRARPRPRPIQRGGYPTRCPNAP